MVDPTGTNSLQCLHDFWDERIGWRSVAGAPPERERELRAGPVGGLLLGELLCQLGRCGTPDGFERESLVDDLAGGDTEQVGRAGAQTDADHRRTGSEVVDTSSLVRADHGDSSVLRKGVDLDAAVGNGAVSIRGATFGHLLHPEARDMGVQRSWRRQLPVCLSHGRISAERPFLTRRAVYGLLFLRTSP